ncbi:hypothetical protein RirG_128870 [Rhizophagus irregularis DAOM 197198w]|uniref:Uncharacterized protein n=1 Tax=Rhizophagus irregularis (strain DAOM 197198w) TaxID=1432141 RepID=A0A015L0P6_RHIIW|nr:hypothetical protein RirG_128870 [Rhizophagus irregularis DAOM 197198w]
MQKRANAIKVPADIGRIPYKIATGEGFSRFTADQWKTFILIYATSITWDLLQESDKLILANFVRACNILVCRSITTNGLEEAHKNLLEVAKLIEENYGAEKITPTFMLTYLPLCVRLWTIIRVLVFQLRTHERSISRVGKITVSYEFG